MIGGFIGHPIGGTIGDTGRTAALSATLADATLSATGALAIAGSLSATLADATLSATGAVALTGALTATLDDALLTATGALLITGAETTTLDDATLSATGALDIKAELAATLEDATLSAASQLLIQGVVEVTLDDAVISSEGESYRYGGGAIFLSEKELAAIRRYYRLRDLLEERNKRRKRRLWAKVEDAIGRAYLRATGRVVDDPAEIEEIVTQIAAPYEVQPGPNVIDFDSIGRQLTEPPDIDDSARLARQEAMRRDEDDIECMLLAA